MKNFGDDKLFYNVLNDDRIRLLEILTEFKDDFYLAGGTALALQIGHRISVDFDFFTSKNFKNFELLKRIEKIFYEYKISVIQNENDTISVILNNEIKLSFFKLEYSNYFSLVNTKYFNIAQVKEIAIMKLLALFRFTYKDYVDIYFILKELNLQEIIQSAEKKHSNFDKSLYIKALLSYDDVDDFPIKFLAGNEIKRREVFDYIEMKTIEYIKTNI